MAYWRKITIVLSLALIALTPVLVGCAKSTSTTGTIQTAKVQSGNLVVSTTTTGNLAFTQTENIAFDMAGTVEQVMVETGDSVKKGDILATLDASAWNDQLKTLQKAVATAQNNLLNAESNISSQQIAVRQAQINLLSAQDAVTSIPIVRAAQDSVDIAQAALNSALASSSIGANVSAENVIYIQQRLDAAKAGLNSILSGTSFNLSSDLAVQIAKAELNVDQCQHQLDDALRAVTTADQSRDDAIQAVQDAQDAVKEAQALSPEVTAPFDGIVTTVSVQGGQAINKGAVAVQIADPSKFEVSVLVGERNISTINIGGVATVSVDSMTNTVLPATITAIAPTATIQQGVVNYQVTVALRSGIPINSNNNTSGFPGSSSGGYPSGNNTAPGSIRSSGNTTNQTAGGRFGNSPSGGNSAPVAQSVTLRQGLSVTVNLITASKSNVLMAPNRAIIKQQGSTYVEIHKNGTSEKVQVTTGISNSQYTEISQGVAEGDIVILQVTTTSSSTNQQRNGIFGGGGILR
jgi:HlyD family secretion protein